MLGMKLVSSRRAILTGPGSATRHFKAPNDVHIQYYRYVCISNCFPPQFQWIPQAKEKYQLTSLNPIQRPLSGGHDPGCRTVAGC